MPYVPKAEIARNIDGMDRSRRERSRRISAWRLIGMCLSLVLVVWAMTHFGEWGRRTEAPAPKTERKREAARQAAPRADDADLFRDMSFLRQAKRAEAPGVFLKTLDGGERSPARQEGKIVLINFWATWCQPCVREMPAIERLYRKYKARGLEIVAVSLDQGGAEEVRAFAGKLGLTFPILLDPGHEARALYKVRGLPTTYLVDRKGRVAGYGIGPREWDSEAAYALVGHLLDEKG